MAAWSDRLRRRSSHVAPRGRHFASAQALTAAGDSISGGHLALGSAAGTPKVDGGRQAWQTEGWGYYDAFGELHYGAQFTGSCYSRIKLYLAWRNDANETAPVYDDEGNLDPDCPVNPQIIAKASAVLGAFRDPTGGTASLMEQFGKNLTVAGDCHLLGRDYHDDLGLVVARRWEVLSVDELRRRKNIRRAPDGTPLEPEFERVIPGNQSNVLIDLDAFLLRVYRRHPRYSSLADSAVRPLLDIMENLVLLTRQLRSTTLSRLAGAGVLWVPSEIDFPDDDTAPEGSEEDDPFARTLIRQMTTAVTDRSAPSAVVPLVVRADADLISAVTHMTFDVGDDTLAMSKMTALLQRFAQGMDLPVEVTMGHQNTTYANAVQIDDSTYKAHIEPGVDIVVGFLTVGYLWTSLGVERPVDAEADLPMPTPLNDPDGITRLVICADPSNLVTHENREANAIELGVKAKPPLISASSTRRALGWTNADAPDADERAEWIRIQQEIAVKESIRAEEPATEAPNLGEKAIDALAKGANNDRPPASTGV